MNKYILYIKFIIKKNDKGKLNRSLLFPLAGVIIGSITVSLTFSIMEGMESSIFSQLKNISFPARLNNINNDYYNTLYKYLNKNNITYQNGFEDQIIVSNDSNFRMVEVHGIEYLDEFAKNILFPNNKEIIIDNDSNYVFIGKGLAYKLDVRIGDQIFITNSRKLNIFTGMPQSKEVFIADIYDVDILDLNYAHIFISYNLLEDFLSSNYKLIYLDNQLTYEELNYLQENYPNLDYNIWEKDHNTFISAMKLEKYTYTLIGFLIIAIAGFTQMSMMSLSVMQKIPQIGILQTMGMKPKDIKLIFLTQALLTSIIGSIVGISLSILFIYFDGKYDLIYMLFPANYFFNFPLILNISHILLIFFTSIFLLVIGGLIPAYKASKINPIDAIVFKS